MYGLYSMLFGLAICAACCIAHDMLCIPSLTVPHMFPQMQQVWWKAESNIVMLIQTVHKRTHD